MKNWEAQRVLSPEHVNTVIRFPAHKHINATAKHDVGLGHSGTRALANDKCVGGAGAAAVARGAAR